MVLRIAVDLIPPRAKNPPLSLIEREGEIVGLALLVVTRVKSHGRVFN
jgi:hypothetical protein